jgi:RNA:NAD 2'-phosphotransferase (TPT1/KptA family)
VEASKIKSELRVALDTKGVHLVEAPAAKMKQAKRSQIKAVILEAARRRYQVTEGGEIRRALEVHERDK